MSDFNKYIESYDYSTLIRFFTQYGTLKQYKKDKTFCRQGESCRVIGLVQQGIFHYTAVDSAGAEHVVGFAFENSFVTDYGAFRLGHPARVTIKAITDSLVIETSYEKFSSFFESSLDNLRMALKITEILCDEIYSRYISLYTLTPEQRYAEMLRNSPRIFNLIPLKELASYLNIRPETLSRIRHKKMME